MMPGHRSAPHSEQRRAEVLAERILKSAAQGERDRERLLEAALMDLVAWADESAVKVRLIEKNRNSQLAIHSLLCVRRLHRHHQYLYRL